jgi:serine/threonine-protein kinase HipA
MSIVHTNLKITGLLSREPDDTFAFRYTPGNPPDNIISIRMPVTQTPYLTDTPTLLHPAFAANLPEGILLLTIQQLFKKILPDMDDLTLLEITGRNQMGRIRVAPNNEKIEKAPEISLSELLQIQGTEEFHQYLLKTYARYSGISGMQPKILIKDRETAQRGTIKGNTHIVKFFNRDEHPALALNEFLCLTAAKNAGASVPNLQMAKDATRLIIERFDTNPDGSYKAMEDCCTLDNLQPNAKYLGSYEEIADIIKNSLSQHNRKQGMIEFFQAIILSTILRNGDAHRKNFSILYNQPDNISLSPVYDIVTTTVYIPKDVPALLMNGTKQWPSKENLDHFGQNSCELTRQNCNEILDRTQTAVSKTLENLHDMLPQTSDQASKKTLQNMESAWKTGLKSLQPSSFQIPFDTGTTPACGMKI